MKVSTIISINNWNQFITDHPNGSVFQSPEMFELFEKTKKFEPLKLGCYDDNGVLCGILMGVYIYEKSGPGKILSSRFVVYGGPLIGGTKKEKNSILDAILKALIRETEKKALFIQFRNFFSWQEYLPVMEENGFELLDRLNYIVQVPDTGPFGFAQDRFRITGMSTTRRRQIRNGLASGAEIIEPENIEQVKAFYYILYTLYRNKVNKPLPDWSFFYQFYKQTLKHGNTETPEQEDTETLKHRHPLGIIRLIRYKDKIIGGILSPIWQDKVIYEWYVCGLDHEYKSQYPSVLATWAAIDYAIENNIQTFDFMGVGTPDKEYGVREFKARFGGEMVNHGRFTRVNNKTLYGIAELGYNVLALLKKI